MEDVLLNAVEDPEEAPEAPAASPDLEQEEVNFLQKEVEENFLQKEVEEQLVDDPSVSGNEVYQNEIISLLSEMKGDLEDVKRINERLLQKSQYIGIPDDILSDNDVDDQSEYLSSNIITKPINDYTVSEALLLIEVVVIFGVIIFLAIRKAVFKWR